jgi:cytosine deaminase
MAIRLVSSARLRGYDGLVDIALDADGTITGIEPSRPEPSGQGSHVLEVAGRVVVPAFVESHLHLDKALIGGPPGGGSLADAITWTRDRKAEMTHADIADRAGRVLAAALANGTTAIRAHTEVDPGIGLLGVEVIAGLADDWCDRVDLQIAVFPQEGLHARPGTLELMRAALELPRTLVGGCPYVEADVTDARLHLRQVLELAAANDRDADLHLDFAEDVDDPRFVLAEAVAELTLELGWAGRVSVGHATTLAALGGDARRRTFDRLAEAGVCVTALPATDLYLCGVVAPVRELWRSGVPVALSSNNLRNAFTPTGNADLLDIALLAARIAQVSDQADFDALLDAITVVPGGRMDPRRGSGIAAGGIGDLVVLESDDPLTVILDQPGRYAVLHRGHIVGGSLTGRHTVRF